MLPKPLTSFIGRHRELAAIGRLWANPDCRLLTLLGPGGIGKTRLALELAHRESGRFADGAVFAPLQAVTGLDLLATAVADALGIVSSGQPDPRARLLSHLADKKLLLVLDNFEQLVDEADLLSQILARAPAVRLLVTSRAALRLQKEWLYPLSGLPYPASDQAPPAWSEASTFEAVQLFVERVERVRPGFPAAAEQAHVLRICRLVEGIPLALELAAAWGRSLDCAAIAAEIERNLTFLTSPLRNVADRHRSMQAVFTHSWALLTPAEQAVFQQLAVFRGGFRREAAEAVAGATLLQLTALVDKSLLRWEANGRYQVHELLRQYAEEQLRRSDAQAIQTCRRHADYYLDFLYRRHDAMLGGRQREAADEIAAELENIRAAWDWAARRAMAEALGRATEPLAMFCHIKSRYLDAARIFEAALSYLADSADGEEPVIALLLSELGWITIRPGDENGRAAAVAPSPQRRLARAAHADHGA